LPIRHPEIISRARAFYDRTAIVAADGLMSYEQLDAASERVAGRILDGRDDLGEARVAFLVPAGARYAAIQWGIWRAGGIAVPLATSHPPAELDYAIRDSGAELVIAGGGYEARVKELAARAGVRYLWDTAAFTGPPVAGPDVPPDRGAMMVYTSGTTGKPKGVVTTHANVAAQITALVEAWGWSAEDRVLLVLPLHHIHGIVVVLDSALWSGACVDAHAEFDPLAAWDSLSSGDITTFMAVPTIYRRLIASWEAATPDVQRAWSDGARRLRLMVSGSAALPVSTLERWQEITGHVLLERYGMTEIGIALSNPLRGERRPGCVGMPLPGVEARLVDERGRLVPPGETGELEVRGPTVFREYWGREAATREAFRDGWFRTGDVARLDRGSYRLLGRSSVDIIKTGGYKVSALEIEETLRTHPDISECAVVGVANPDWGEVVSAAVELVPGATLSLGELRLWAKERLAPYKVPAALAVVDALPRNAMGKVVKPDVSRLFG
jgi:malonyl-CoA/methylmalonyl-CoA synthetase